MVTWSVTSTSVPPSEYFCAGTSPCEDAANYAALSYVGALISDVPGETPYDVIIGTEAYTVTVEEARNTVIAALAHVLDVFAYFDIMHQRRAAAEL